MSYLRARAYDSSLGRFLTPDPVVLLRGLSYVGNPYAYANNDPVNFTDPLGTIAVPFAELIAAIALVVAAITSQGPSCGRCPHFGNIIGRHEKCFWRAACLETRGYLSMGDLYMSQAPLEDLWHMGQRERTAQAAAINELFRGRGGGISPNVDWEVYAFSGHVRLDILADSLEDVSSETMLFEVKEYSGPATNIDVRDQINGYIRAIGEIGPRGYGVQLTPSTELAGWMRTYSVGTTMVWAWGPSSPQWPGHIYLASESKMSAGLRVLLMHELLAQIESSLARVRNVLSQPPGGSSKGPISRRDRLQDRSRSTGPYGGGGEGYGLGDSGVGDGVPVGVGRGQSPFPG